MKKCCLTLIILILLLIKNQLLALEFTDVNDFISDVKNYSYKSQFKIKNNTTSKDIENLKIKILKQIEDNPSLLHEIQNFIRENKELSFLFNDMLKGLKEKQKFEMLQNGLNQNSKSVISKTNSEVKYKISLAEKLFYYFKFTSAFNNNSRFVNESPEILKEYTSIKNEFDEIDNMDALRQKGPGLAKRSESLILNPQGGFYNLERLENLAIMAALINVRLAADDWETADSLDLKLRVVKYLEQLYRSIPHFKHKCLFTMTISDAYVNANLPEKGLLVSYYNKKDFYENLNNDEKIEFICYLGNLTLDKCKSGDEQCLKIGIECFHEYCQLIELDSTLDDVSKANKKAEVYLGAISVLYEKNEKYFEAIAVLDRVINDENVHQWMRNSAAEKKQELQGFLKLKINVMFSNEFMSDKWKIIDKSYKYIPLFTNQKIKLKVELEQPPDSNIKIDSVKWYGDVMRSEQEFEFSFAEPGKKFLKAEVQVLEKTIIKNIVIYVKSKPEGMNEKEYVLNNLAMSFKAINLNLITSGDPSTLEPYNWAEKTYADNGPHNGIQDAARHVYWNCLLARYFGEDYAKGITDGHEVNTPSEQFAEVVMDLHNNEQGRQLSKEHSHSSNDNNYNCCQEAVITAIKNGNALYFDDLENSKNDALLLPTNEK
ncbi:MAG: hypothetical protein QMC67_10915 [Candidatus Wallbacteria bacterium]